VHGLPEVVAGCREKAGFCEVRGLRLAARELCELPLPAELGDQRDVLELRADRRRRDARSAAIDA